MAELAENMQRMAGGYIDHPIVDATGLEGGWDFVIGWTPQGAMQAGQRPRPDQPAGAVADASDPNSISAFEALEKELE